MGKMNIKAKERLVRFDSSKQGEYRYIMQPEIYGAIGQDIIMTEVAQRSGLPEYSISAVLNALAEVMTKWATNGHSVPIPGLGTMRFGLRAQSVADVKDVGTSLIRSRRIVFTPSGELKRIFGSTSISITCFDRNGEVVKRVESKDDGTVEDEGDGTTTTDPGTGDNTGSDNPGSDSGSGEDYYE
jgi:predicted histone-like DNA-binding protein